MRITLTLAALINSKEIILLFFGAAKRAVYEQSLEVASTYPLARLLQQNQTPVRAIWAL
jgi:6-phosphogluconolactonase/glucosamine-6-phosphate isomerase/deaminase